MFKHILVPVDGSPTSMMAVSKAAGLAKAFGSAVTILYVIDPYPFTGVGADFAYGQAQYLSAATAEANAALDAAKKASGGRRRRREERCVRNPGNPRIRRAAKRRPIGGIHR